MLGCWDSDFSVGLQLDKTVTANSIKTGKVKLRFMMTLILNFKSDNDCNFTKKMLEMGNNPYKLHYAISFFREKGTLSKLNTFNSCYNI